MAYLEWSEEIEVDQDRQEQADDLDVFIDFTHGSNQTSIRPTHILLSTPELIAPLSIKSGTETPLACIAAQAGDVKLLNQEGAKCVRESTDENGQNCLHIASAHGHVAAIKHLLAMEADVAAANDMLATPLHMAAAHGHAECCSVLLMKKATADTVDRNGWYVP